MRDLLLAVLVVATLSGCGHSPTNYTPGARSGMTWDGAISVVERGFYEDYGKERPEAVQFTKDAIVLSDGSVTTATHAGTVVPIYGAAALVGSASAKTVAAGQRIYFASLMPAIVLKRNARENRYAVIVRTSPGVTSRRVFFRSESRAEEFADALEYLRSSRPSTVEAIQEASESSSGMMSKDQYKQIQIQRLMEQNLPYEEYTRRMRELDTQ